MTIISKAGWRLRTIARLRAANKPRPPFRSQYLTRYVLDQNAEAREEDDRRARAMARVEAFVESVVNPPDDQPAFRNISTPTLQ
jgi:hypothetical protein